MQVLRWAAGIDVSKDDFWARIFCLTTTGELRRRNKRRFINTPKGFTAFHSWLLRNTEAQQPCRVVMEATGVYHENLAYKLHELGCWVSVVLPNMVKSYAGSLNQPSKTDAIDADIIARLGAERDTLRQWLPANQSMQRLKVLSRERQALISDRTCWKNRHHALTHSAMKSVSTLRRYTQHLKFINKQIGQVEAEMQRLRKGDEQLEQSIDLLTTPFGVGAITALTIMAETDGLVLFTSRSQLIKYAGLDIVEKQSGSSVRGKARISKRGNSRLRAALFMPALCAIRKPGVFQQVYQKQVDRHGCRPRALMAVQRKLLIVIYALHKKKERYDQSVHQGKSQNEVGRTQELCLQ